jgi:cyclopropane fatty-acyl-phospholipid synthase-like methyltransferase
MTAEKPNAPATERNRDVILQVLQDEFRESRSVLEIGSGTGQHAVFFARALPHLIWQSSDREINHAGIQSWIDDAGLENVRMPLLLDVEVSERPDDTFEAVFSANTAHIMGFPAVECMFSIVGACLIEGGVFCLYGPFNQNGAFTSPSNEKFDASLKAQDVSMGIRNLEDLDALAEVNGMTRVRLYAMPANNNLVVWQKAPAPA